MSSETFMLTHGVSLWSLIPTFDATGYSDKLLAVVDRLIWIAPVAQLPFVIESVLSHKDDTSFDDLVSELCVHYEGYNFGEKPLIRIASPDITAAAAANFDRAALEAANIVRVFYHVKFDIALGTSEEFILPSVPAKMLDEKTEYGPTTLLFALLYVCTYAPVAAPDLPKPEALVDPFLQTNITKSYYKKYIKPLNKAMIAYYPTWIPIPYTIEDFEQTRKAAIVSLYSMVEPHAGTTPGTYAASKFVFLDTEVRAREAGFKGKAPKKAKVAADSKASTPTASKSTSSTPAAAATAAAPTAASPAAAPASGKEAEPASEDEADLYVLDDETTKVVAEWKADKTRTPYIAGLLSKEMKDLCTILSDFNLQTAVDPQMFVDFGLVNSSVYRARFMNLTKALSPDERFMVVALAVSITSRKRILKNMDIFKDKTVFPWFPKVKDWYSKVAVQYTPEVTDTSKSFATVHIPGCMPSVAALAWRTITTPSKRTVTRFLDNRWAAQLTLDSDMMAKQMMLERKMWNSVKKSASGNLEAGGFNKSYWDQKSQDAYALLHDDNTVVPVPAGGYKFKDLKKWLAE